MTIRFNCEDSRDVISTMQLAGAGSDGSVRRMSHSIERGVVEWGKFRMAEAASGQEAV